ncbi:tRNA methyltransferase [Mycena belliarum]|uniref:tRNA (guanine(26)-N(2))-dimethyltransferase n=1 Tax=Mycena belliarum TaxID=1033014 RepID=A0AAD6XRC3_9AGAR|nr:tRNA methyltransferase [Mycena belliae]
MASTHVAVPEGFTLHTENTSHILLSANEAFLNPIQEFNRDTSVACIRIWSEELHNSKVAHRRLALERKARRRQSKKLKRELPDLKNPNLTADTQVEADADTLDITEPVPARAPGQEPQSKFVILEALSATGLRSIRYAKEIPHVRYIIANDLSPTAIEAMNRNIEFNGLGSSISSNGVEIKVNEGDACTLMYNHRESSQRVDVVDLDPYGTAAPFIDAAVQCIRDDGLLCVTCTDLTVLATTNYPEKCFSNYGGVPIKAEYCHEAALRLVLHSISTSAARYGRYIQPLLSLSIDFYVRLFIRIKTSPLEVKNAVTKTSTYWVCPYCQSFYGQTLAKVTEKAHQNGSVNYNFKLQSGPPVGDKCPECDSLLHMAGPMWSAPIHDPPFVGKVLEHLEANTSLYGTASRMKGMLTVAKEELDSPFYFTPTRISKFFHCQTPSFAETTSALLHGGHKVSRSHASAGSIKTTASRAELLDIFRSWIKLHPVKGSNIPTTSPAHRLLEKEPKVEANFATHPETATHTAKVNLVRYQENPTANWGPGTKAISGKGPTGAAKRKHEEVEE